MAMRKRGVNSNEAGRLDTKGQIKQLRAVVEQLKSRIRGRTRPRALEMRALAEARRTRARVGKEMNALRRQGRRLAGQLRQVLRNSRRKQRLERRAVAQVAELREQLRRKTEELRAKK